MTRPIWTVLTQSELEEIEAIEKTISDLSQAVIIANVSHIVCDMYEDPWTQKDVVEARVYIDSRQPYSFVYEKINMHSAARDPSDVAKMDYLSRANELLARRRGHLHEFKGRPHERKAFEAKLRKEEIDAHRHYLHELEGMDPGLFVAAAHWLKEYSDYFCALAEFDYEELDVEDFCLMGLERAVVIKTPGSETNNVYSVIAMSQDLTCEETAAQYASGLIKLVESGDESFAEKAQKLRKNLLDAENAMHFCVLSSKKPK